MVRYRESIGLTVRSTSLRDQFIFWVARDVCRISFIQHLRKRLFFFERIPTISLKHTIHYFADHPEWPENDSFGKTWGHILFPAFREQICFSQIFPSPPPPAPRRPRFSKRHSQRVFFKSIWVTHAKIASCERNPAFCMMISKNLWKHFDLLCWQILTHSSSLRSCPSGPAPWSQCWLRYTV